MAYKSTLILYTTFIFFFILFVVFLLKLPSRFPSSSFSVTIATTTATMKFLILLVVIVSTWTLNFASGEIWSSPSERTVARTKRQDQLPQASVKRIVEFLQRKNIYRKYNLNRALDEWKRLGRSTPEPEMRDKLKQVVTSLLPKAKADYVRQAAPTAVNVTGNSVVFRAMLKFYVEAGTTPMKYAVFPFLFQELERRGLWDIMSLDDAIVFSYIWNQEIIGGGLVRDPIQGPTADTVSNRTEKLIRSVVRAANRIYPPGPPDGEPVSISEWWLRQRQHSTNVYKVYHLIDALVHSYRQQGLETATIYESLVDEYKKSGRPLDAYELNMIDYLAYRMFGFIENADPERW